jgi:formamidopyrimidine-DNA glycosylase
VPELPEVEAVCRRLEPYFSHQQITRVELRRPDLRSPFPRNFRARLEGQTVDSLTRRAKYLVAALSSRETLLMHLGMSGSFRVDAPGNASVDGGGRSAEPDRHDHVVFHLASGAVVTFNDPRRFGAMDLLTPMQLARHGVLSGLGPEPLSSSFDAVALARACRGKKVSLKVALLDQRVVAGLGNIYLARAIDRQARDYRSSRFRVYDREGERCLRARCGGTVARRLQAGRSTFYCPVCQK